MRPTLQYSDFQKEHRLYTESWIYRSDPDWKKPTGIWNVATDGLLCLPVLGFVKLSMNGRYDVSNGTWQKRSKGTNTASILPNSQVMIFQVLNFTGGYIIDDEYQRWPARMDIRLSTVELGNVRLQCWIQTCLSQSRYNRTPATMISSRHTPIALKMPWPGVTSSTRRLVTEGSYLYLHSSTSWS